MNTVAMPESVQDIMRELTSDLFAVKNPRTGKPVQFKLSKGQHNYIYFRSKKTGADYCYTPHPDLDGWFYSFAYMPIGKGSRINKAKRWTMKKLACHRKRKDAEKRALKLKEQESTPAC